MPEEEIQLELAEQNITKVKRFMYKKDGQLRKTNTFVLTFDQADLPDHIRIGYLRVKVEVFVPNPLRCYKCQKYGHGQNSCKRQQVCFKCGNHEHDSDSCHGPLHCVNCGGSHTASSKQCPVWSKECAIQKVRVTQKLSFAEARKVVELTSPPTLTHGSYAHVAAKGKADASTQTDATTQTDPQPVLAEKQIKDKKDHNKAIAPDSKAMKSMAVGTSVPSEAQVTEKSDPPNSARTQVPKRPESSKVVGPPKSGGVKPALNQDHKGKVQLNRQLARPSKGSDDPVREYLTSVEGEIASTSKEHAPNLPRNKKKGRESPKT